MMIEKTVPPPNPVLRLSALPFGQLEVNDSFVVPADRKMRQRLSNIMGFAQKNFGIRLMSKIERDDEGRMVGYRVWRVG